MNEELKVIISAEISKLKSGINEAKGAVNGFKSEVSKGKEAIGKAWTTIGEGATKASKVMVTGVAAIGTALVGTSALTAEYRENMAKLTAAFETSGASAEVAKGTYNDLYRVLGDSDVAVEAANHLAKMTTNEKELAEWTNICQGVYATFGDSLPIEGLTEAANETAKVGVVTGTLADALNWAGISEDAFNEKLAKCNSEAEREKLIRETLNGVYDEAAQKYEKNAADLIAQREAQAKLQESLAQLGAAVQPVITMFVNLATQALAVVVPYIQDLAQKYAPMLQSVLQGIGNFLAPIGTFIMNHLPLIATIGGIIMGIAAAYQVASGALAIYTTIKELHTAATTIATVAQTAFAGATWAAIAPILAVVAAIAAIIAIIVLCVKHWDEIKAKVKEVWDAIVGWITNAVAKIKEIFGNMKQAISEKVDEIKSGVSEKFESMKENMGNIMQAAKDTVSEKLNNMKQAYNEHGGGIKGIASAAMEGVKGYYTAGYTFINNLTGGKLGEVASKMKEKMNTAKQNVASALDGIKSGFSEKLQSAVSTVSTKLGSIKDKFSSIMENAKTIVKNAIDKIKGFFNFKWSLPKLKLPHFSISGKFSLNPPSTPRFSVSWYQFGGVFDNPTLFPWAGGIGGLGENGAEAIVPLEKNTKWLDRMATMLNEKQGGSRPIILQVDGKTFAEIAVDSINNLTELRGAIPLKIW